MNKYRKFPIPIPEKRKTLSKPIVGVFGISGQWEHDHSFAIIKNSQVFSYIELERISRKKHDNSMSQHFSDIAHNIPFPETYDFSYANSFPEDEWFMKHANSRLTAENKALDIVPLIEPDRLDRIDLIPGKVLGSSLNAHLIPHELAHLGTCLPFVRSFKNNSLLVHVDGAASISNSSVWQYNNEQIDYKNHSTHLRGSVLNFSMNNLVHAILETTLDQQLSVPGKLMGYASYGNATPDMIEWLEDHAYFFDHFKEPGKFFKSIQEKFGYEDIDQRNQLFFDIHPDPSGRRTA